MFFFDFFRLIGVSIKIKVRWCLKWKIVGRVNCGEFVDSKEFLIKKVFC